MHHYFGKDRIATVCSPTTISSITETDIFAFYHTTVPVSLRRHFFQKRRLGQTLERRTTYLLCALWSAFYVWLCLCDSVILDTVSVFSQDSRVPSNIVLCIKINHENIFSNTAAANSLLRRGGFDESSWCMPECGLIIKSNSIIFHVSAGKTEIPIFGCGDYESLSEPGSVVEFHRNCINSRFVILELNQEVLSV